MLLLLCVLLLVWQPLQLAVIAAGQLDAIAIHGWPLAAMLFLRVAVAGVGIAAGLTLISRRPFAVGFAKAALVLSAMTDLFVYATPYFPNNRMPGDTPLYIAGSLVYHGGWLVYLSRSRQVRNTFGV